jgi:periplasmic divalent cation tolerance protein
MMGKSSEFRIVLVTCGSTKEARKIAKAAVAKRLAACVNIISAPVESVYIWKGRVEKGRERLLIIKTSAARLKKLKAAVLRVHSYETPEFLVIAIASGSKEYMAWLKSSLI